jgi:prepilin-type N-terminal cleavage/methylation domain-containing protein
MNGRKAFTLVELLVVIAIIALLMAILMPALNRVREQGRMVKCLANMKQWNLIAAMYTEENQGKFWPSDAGTQCYWWIKYIEDKYKDWKTNKLWFCPSAQKPQTDERGVTTPVLNIYNAWGIYKESRTYFFGFSPAAFLSLLTILVFSQVKSGRFLPKWPP